MDHFMLTVDQAEKKAADFTHMRLPAETGSDQAFQEWQVARVEGRERRLCKANMVSSSTMEMVVWMRNQVLAQLRTSGSGNIRTTGGWW